MEGGIIQWFCYKQTGVSLSSRESQLTSASHLRRELLALKELMRKISFKVEELCA